MIFETERTRLISSLILACVALPARPALLWSQLAAVTSGSRVRVTASTIEGRAIVGTLMSPIVDTVVITAPVRGTHPDSPTAVRRHLIPVSSLERLEVSLGRSRSTGAELGVKLGALAAVTFGIVCALGDVSARGIGPLSRGEIVGLCAAGTVIVSLPLMAGGAVVGALVRREKWRRLVF